MNRLPVIAWLAFALVGCAEPIKLLERSVPGANVKVGSHGWLAVTLDGYLDRGSAIQEFRKYAGEAAKDNIECSFGSDEINFTTDYVTVSASEKATKTKKKGEETETMAGKTVVSGWVLCKYATK